LLSIRRPFAVPARGHRAILRPFPGSYFGALCLNLAHHARAGPFAVSGQFRPDPGELAIGTARADHNPNGGRKTRPPIKGKAKMKTIEEMKAESKNAAKIAAAARAALAKAEKNLFRDLAVRVSTYDPKQPLAAAEVADLVEQAKGLLG